MAGVEGGRIAIATLVRDERPLLPWFLANTRFADEVCILDTGSSDGTWDYLLEQAGQDARLRIRRTNLMPVPYVNESPSRLESLSLIDDEFDWVLVLDVDEIPCVRMQRQLPLWKPIPSDEIAVVPLAFYYLAPEWMLYYHDVSQYLMESRLYTKPPKVGKAPNGDAALEVARRKLPTPDGWMLLHWNWALANRFARKMGWYESRFKQTAWHPEQRGWTKLPLPDGARWYDPQGCEVGPEDMIGRMAEVD